MLSLISVQGCIYIYDNIYQSFNHNTSIPTVPYVIAVFLCALCLYIVWKLFAILSSLFNISILFRSALFNNNLTIETLFKRLLPDIIYLYAYFHNNNYICSSNTKLINEWIAYKSIMAHSFRWLYYITIIYNQWFISLKIYINTSKSILKRS